MTTWSKWCRGGLTVSYDNMILQNRHWEWPALTGIPELVTKRNNALGDIMPCCSLIHLYILSELCTVYSVYITISTSKQCWFDLIMASCNWHLLIKDCHGYLISHAPNKYSWIGITMAWYTYILTVPGSAEQPTGVLQESHRPIYVSRCTITFTRKRTLDIPPSTTKSLPLTKLLSSLARKTTAWACSMASPKRPVGKCTSRRKRLGWSSPSQSCRRGVLSRSVTD